MKYKDLQIRIYVFLILSVFYLSCNSQPATKNKISLEGTWKFQIDKKDIGIEQKWYQNKLNDDIKLPGSMRDNNKGDDLTIETLWTGTIYDSSWYFRPDMAKYREADNIKFPFWLTPNKHYVGAAWYQREVNIPESWKGQKIELFLERPHWETILWIDDVKVGFQNSLSTPHKYNLTSELTPGHHTITLRIDNRIKEINVGPDSHSITDHTQGNWNGIVGDIFLKSVSPISFNNVKLITNVDEKSVKAVIDIENISGKEINAKILMSAKSFNSAEAHNVDPLTEEINVKSGNSIVEITYPMSDDVKLWDEFNPNLYKMTLVLSDDIGNIDEKEIQFGMRKFSINGTRFEINGSPTFLRGTVDCAVFPKNGYPPTDVASWERILKKCKDFGLNHIRFHSWCPPKAAFEAADRVGLYLQPEGASWANHGVTLGDGLPIDQFIYDETNRIVEEYGNHPSFCMMAYGNEPAGRNQVKYLGEFVNYWKAKDNRIVYTSASIGGSWPLTPESEFIVRAEPRGLPWKKRPQSMFDYFERIEKYDVPYVVHEMGQFCVYPNFKEIKKYTGIYKAKNFELFKEELNNNHMGDQAEDFFMASGKLQALCYKSEIEAAMRTKNLAGIQLLGLNDFSGQGTALVGVLDAFWDEKEYISADEFKQFFGATIPLARLPKFVYKNNELFTAEIEVSHFDKKPIKNITPQWKITNSVGVIVSEGTLSESDILIGNCIKLGKVSFELSQIKKADKLNLEVAIDDYINNWNFWVYPADLPKIEKNDIYYCNELDEKAKTILDNGGKVFLFAADKVENGKDVAQYFRPVFWNTSWFKMRPPHTTGILCDPKHPAFDDFPTEYHSNLQWWEILDREQVMNLENFPPEFRPIIQPIDTWFLNRRLAMLFEAKVGKGKLIVCSSDLENNLDERPAARQLLYSVKIYMMTNEFNPKYKVDYSTIVELFEKKNRPPAINTYTKQSPADLMPKVK